MYQMEIVLSGEQAIGKTFVARQLRAALPEWFSGMEMPMSIKIITSEVFPLVPEASHLEAIVEIK